MRGEYVWGGKSVYMACRNCKQPKRQNEHMPARMSMPKILKERIDLKSSKAYFPGPRLERAVFHGGLLFHIL